ncbi:MAG TPA: GNAT family protein [Saprospiraceae bacterium]|nr:GNAT family protein [Saprospiraceae bacterium]
MEFEILETSRLYLKAFTPDHYRYLFHQCSSDEIKSQLGLFTDEAFEAEKKKWEKGLTSHDRSFLHFQLIHKNTNEILGGCGYPRWYHHHFRAEIGYSLNQDSFKRQGYMSEAIDPILHYGFRKMNLKRIEACVGPDNQASIKLLEKFKFTREGYLRQHYYKDGRMYDSLIYSLLREEFT